MKITTRTKAILAAVGVYTIWGFSFMASRVALDFTTPFVLLSCRFLLALLILSVPLILGKVKLRLKGKNILPLLALGSMEPCAYFICEQYGILYTNSAFSGVIIAIIPIVTLIMAAAFLKDRPTLHQWLFSILSIVGIIVITLTENSGGDIRTIGVIFLLIAVITSSAHVVISRKISDEFSVYERSYIMQLMGAVLFTVLALVEQRGNPAAILAPLANIDFILAILYLAACASALGFVLLNYAVSKAPMANVMSLCNLTTVISVIAGIVFLQEPFSVVSIIAMVAVVFGIWGVQKFGPKQ